MENKDIFHILTLTLHATKGNCIPFTQLCSWMHILIKILSHHAFPTFSKHFRSVVGSAGMRCCY